MDMVGPELGLGLLSLGRSWGVHNGHPPTDQEAAELLESAVCSDVRIFDTAPAYGTSEERFGRFISRNPISTASLFIATKMGEHWKEDGSTYIDHSFSALISSFQRSLDLLGRIDLLQVHKATASNLTAAETLRALDVARRAGVHEFGASVSDIGTARLAAESKVYRWLQFPYNASTSHLDEIFAIAETNGLRLLINRPLAMGAALDPDDKSTSLRNALSFILKRRFVGAVLTGTRSPRHLAEVMSAFRQVKDSAALHVGSR